MYTHNCLKKSILWPSLHTGTDGSVSVAAEYFTVWIDNLTAPLMLDI